MSGGPAGGAAPPGAASLGVAARAAEGELVGALWALRWYVGTAALLAWLLRPWLAALAERLSPARLASEAAWAAQAPVIDEARKRDLEGERAKARAAQQAELELAAAEAKREAQRRAADKIQRMRQEEERVHGPRPVGRRVGTGAGAGGA
jgi:hypothetical protein